MPVPKKKKRRIIRKPADFDFIKLRLASPERIEDWSYGEVKKAETINYRTQKPERDGLFCEKIFGPVKDYECNCGKYKHARYRGIVCERCGVEVTRSKVRRERMGHIDLAVPVAHIWFYKAAPTKIGTLLSIKTSIIEKILYYNAYVVIDSGNTPLQHGEVLSEDEYDEYYTQYGEDFECKMGAEAIYDLLKAIDLDELSMELRMELQHQTSKEAKKRIIKRLRLVESFRKSDNRPEWMVLYKLPVIPPDLRPLVALDGGRFATSDLNDLYRRVIARNNRLKNLIQIGAPEIILRNEKRMLQESVDALLDNARRARPIKGRGNRPLKSLTDSLKGKNGRFRQNLLGKRVDYSGRSVIVVGPELKLHQCGLPKKMALELFKPFIIQKLEEKSIANGVKNAKKIIDEESNEVWRILEGITKNHPVLLNRAPTLHRLGIQAFQPVLVEGKAIELHPLVCHAFNADFDGDQMAVHIPLSYEARIEAQVLMISSNNILSPAHGKPLAAPSQDMVIGAYYMTKERNGLRGEGKIFDSEDEVRYLYEKNMVDLHAKIKYKFNDEYIDTTVGRVLFNSLIPEEIRFVNKAMGKKDLSNLIFELYKKTGNKETVFFLDKFKETGFHFATKSGLTFGIDDMLIPEDKYELIEEAQKDVDKINREHTRGGTTTEKERYRKVVDRWLNTRNQLVKKMKIQLSNDRDGFNPIYMMAGSGARGNWDQVSQLVGMRGLMQRPQKKVTGEEIIESPIKSNFKEGLTVLEYFISTHGARKGLTDTALKTAEAGYLTRRLVDVAQDIIVTEHDCGTILGVEMEPIIEKGEIVTPLSARIEGRYALEDIISDVSGEVIVHEGEEITEEASYEIEKNTGINRVKIRSVLTCEAEHGICQKCYGMNLAIGKLVEIGESVGVMAAQSIGEPGTQLTLKTFHSGGTASGEGKENLMKSKISGKVTFKNIETAEDSDGNTINTSNNAQILIKGQDKQAKESILNIPIGAQILVDDKSKIEKNAPLFKWDPYYKPVHAKVEGYVRYSNIIDGQTVKREYSGDEISTLVIQNKDKTLHPVLKIVDKNEKEINKHPVAVGSYITVKNGQKVYPGTIIAKKPSTQMKGGDITGGLPRVVELFEARVPKDKAVISEVGGTVEIGKVKRGERIIHIHTPNNKEYQYSIPYGKHILVYNGEVVEPGNKLCDGAIDPHNLMKIKTVGEVASFLLNQIQEVYRTQGVEINDKHIALIIRQMIKYVKITDSGETEFIQGEIIERDEVDKVNNHARMEGRKPALYQRLLMGIAKSSLNTKSFISAASFQETTKVLTEAAIESKIDYLKGLKENVIMGNLLPAGTGVKKYRKIEDEPIAVNEEDEVTEEPEELKTK
ncbi:MAG: DNA-directed RNA polymerase subunit beta' [candidate division WOR-3 bacterium]|nr:DNA-directed RNA polymerase subunit beta' [candidate division WOR-3 bacterium]